MLRILINGERSNDHSFFLKDPSDEVSNFLLFSMQRFAVLPTLFVQKENSKITTKSARRFFKEPLISSFVRPKNNQEDSYKLVLNYLENGENVSSTEKAGVMFLDWALENGHANKFEIDTLLSISEMAEIYNHEVNKPFFPIAQERLLKLFVFFYKNYMSKEEKKVISAHQNQLIFLERVNISELKEAYYCLSLDRIRFIQQTLKRVQDMEGAPKNPILIKKIEEEFDNFDRPFDVFHRKDFCEIRESKDVSDYFIEKYIEAVA